MVSDSVFKNTFLFLVFLTISCGNSVKGNAVTQKTPEPSAISQTHITPEIITGAENTHAYLLSLKDKKVGIVTNQTGIVRDGGNNKSIVDFLLENKVDLRKIFAPEHGFRGTADAGEHVI